MKEINSIGINKKANKTEVPGGKNKEKKCKPCFFAPKIFIPIKRVNAKQRVITRWLVKVKQYGIKPKRFNDSNSTKMKYKSGT